jgi:hypothetical protein
MNIKMESEEFWISVVEDSIASGSERNVVPVLGFSYDTATALAERLNVRLELASDKYVFVHQVGRPSFQKRELH